MFLLLLATVNWFMRPLTYQITTEHSIINVFNTHLNVFVTFPKRNQSFWDSNVSTHMSFSAQGICTLVEGHLNCFEINIKMWFFCKMLYIMLKKQTAVILIVKLCWQKQTPCTLWCFSAFEFELDFLKLSQKEGAIQIGAAESATRASASSLQLWHWVLTIASHSFCSWQTGEVFPAVIGFNANKALTMTVMFRHACLALTSLFTYCVLMGHASASLMIGSLVSGVRQCSAVPCCMLQRQRSKLDRKK